MAKSKNIETVLAVLQDEIEGNVRAALDKLTEDYTMTWVYKAPKTGELFPRTTKTTKEELGEVYNIKDREYDIRHIAEGDDATIFVEMIESYPDPETGKVYRTPLVLVLEMKNGKIRSGRHYCDPNLSYLNLPEEKMKDIYK
jgi:ketosteroid isomerase-like protein